MTHAISRLLRWLPDSDRGLSAFSTDTSPVISLQLQTANNDALADHICLVVPRSRRGTDGVEVPREYLADLMRLLAWWLRGNSGRQMKGLPQFDPGSEQLGTALDNVSSITLMGSAASRDTATSQGAH